MNSIQKQTLTTNLIAALASKITPDGINCCDDIEVKETALGFQLSTLANFVAKFEEVDSLKFVNHAVTNVQFDFVGCTYNEDTKCYEWNGIFCVNYDLDNNLHWAYKKDDANADEPLRCWAESYGPSYNHEDKISWHVLDAIFEEKSFKEVKALCHAVFNSIYANAPAPCLAA